MSAQNTEQIPPNSFAPVLLVPGTPDMHLTVATADDAGRLFELIEGNRSYLEEYQWWSQDVKTLDDAKTHNDLILQGMAKREGVQYRITPGRPEAPEPWIGTVTFYEHDSRSHSTNFGYWLTEEAQGSGYALRGTERLLTYGREVLGITRAIAHIAKGNEPSEALAVKLGCHIFGRQYATKVDDGINSRTLLMRRWLKDFEEAD